MGLEVTLIYLIVLIPSFYVTYLIIKKGINIILKKNGASGSRVKGIVILMFGGLALFISIFIFFELPGLLLYILDN